MMDANKLGKIEVCCDNDDQFSKDVIELVNTYREQEKYAELGRLAAITTERNICTYGFNDRYCNRYHGLSICSDREYCQKREELRKLVGEK